MTLHPQCQKEPTTCPGCGEEVWGICLDKLCPVNDREEPVLSVEPPCGESRNLPHQTHALPSPEPQAPSLVGLCLGVIAGGVLMGLLALLARSAR